SLGLGGLGNRCYWFFPPGQCPAHLTHGQPGIRLDGLQGCIGQGNIQEEISVSRNFFSNRIKEERKRLGLIQDEMAKIAGVSKHSLVDYENEDKTVYPNAAFLTAIATAGADVLYILTGVRSVPSEQSLSHRAAALVDNYEHCKEEDKAALERLASAAASSERLKESGEKVG
ncbi:MAG: helix-turn-helix domain-containing protein, partial [Verrucomicrobia bacterium]|nr:helix-turn-helix domain-containing protein [Verrucomicrobiota bacterium]